MKKFLLLSASLIIFIQVYAQPASKVYWVGPETGGVFNSSNWATTSGGTAGSYPSNVQYQLVFDGDGTAGKTYTVTMNTTTGGYIVLANNTTVILQATANNSFLTISNTGYNVPAGSKLVLENNGTGSLMYSIASATPANTYNSNVVGELVVKALAPPNPFLAESWLNLSGLINPSGTKVLSVDGILRLEGPRALIHVSNDNSLAFGSNSNFILNSDLTDVYAFAFDPNSVVTLSALARLSRSYPNVIYDAPLQMDTRSLNGTFIGNVTLKSTGTGILTVSGAATGNLSLQGTSNIKATGLTVTKNINIQSGQMDVTGDVVLKGDLINQGIVKSSGSGLIKFAGTVQQLVQPGTINDDAVSFEVANPAGILLGSNWAMPANAASKLTLTKGHIYTGANVLTIQNPTPAAIIGGTDSSHIIGRLRRVTNSASAAYVFPVDNAANESANVKITPAGSSPTTYEVSFTRPNPYNRSAVPAGVKNAGNYFWDISRPAGSENATLTFVYGANKFNPETANQYSDLRVLHWNGSAWDNLGGSGANGEIAVANVSTFSPFSFGTVGLYLLPVRLTSFTGVREGGSNILKWNTAQEELSTSYEVERSADGAGFSHLGTILSGGSTPYSYTDAQPLPSLNFYRLKVTNAAGTQTYSQTIIIRMSSKALLDVHPNPASDVLNVQFATTTGQLNLYNMSGGIVQTVHVNQRGYVSTSINIRSLPPGIYFIKSGAETARFIKQ